MPIGTVDWIAEGMLGAPLVNVESSERTLLGFAVPVRNQFFHGAHPLGWLRGVELSLDSHHISESHLAVVLRGQWLTIPQVRVTSDIWWQPRETAHILADLPAGATAGSHHVELTMHLSTFFFTPLIDRDDRYPTITMRLAAQLPVADERERLF